MVEDYESAIMRALKESSKKLSENGTSIENLNLEQKAAIRSPIGGKDVVAVLLTGFGKSAILINSAVKEFLTKEFTCIL